MNDEKVNDAKAAVIDIWYSPIHIVPLQELNHCCSNCTTCMSITFLPGLLQIYLHLDKNTHKEKFGKLDKKNSEENKFFSSFLINITVNQVWATYSRYTKKEYQIHNLDS